MNESPPIDSIWEQHASQRAAELARMRLVAGGLLLAMAVVFAAASALAPRWPLLAYLRAFAEAAMVGACADWFAVVALFRRPFGLPIPHTAIVPRHKDRIGEAFGRFISVNFLAPAEVNARLERIDAAAWAARWLKDPENAKQAAQHSQGLLPPILDLLRDERVRAFGRDVIRSGVDSIAAAPFAARVLSVMTAQGYHEALFDQALEKARAFLRDHREGIRQKVAKSSLSWLPDWVDGRLTDAFLEELLDALAAAHAADHPIRVEYRAAVKKLINRLANDPQLFDQGERIKADVLDNSVVDGYLNWLGEEVEGKIRAEQASSDGILSAAVTHGLVAFGDWLDRDDHLRAMINLWGRQLVVNTVAPNRAEIGAFVADVVSRWDADTLVEKLELQVGKDLQYIRVNGTLVGGLVGLAIFTATRVFG